MVHRKRLTRVQADNLKNLRELDLPVAPRTVLAGPNGSGKSSILSAVRLAVLGYEPELNDRRLQAIRTQLAAGTANVQTGLVFSDGFAVKAEFGASHDIAVAPPKKERTLAEKKERIREELGTFVLSLDVGELLSLTPQKRREYVFGLLPRERATLTEEQFRAGLGYEEQQNAVRRAIDRLWLEHVLKGESAVEGLASAIRHANEHYNDAVQVRRAKEHHVDELRRDLERAVRELEAGAYDPAVVERLQGDLEAAEAQLAEARQQIHTADEAYRAALSEHDRLLSLSRQRERLVARRAEVEKYIAGQEEQLAKLVVGDEAEFQQRYRELLEKQKDALEAEQEQADLRDAAQSYLLEQKALLSAALDRIRTVEHADRCPTCGSAESLAEFRARQEAEAERLKQIVAMAERSFTSERDALNALRQIREHIDTELADARAAANNAAMAVTHRKNVRESIERAKGEIAQIDTDIEQMGDFTVPPPPSPPVVSDDLPKLQAKIEGLRSQIRMEQSKAVAGAAPETIRQQIDDAEIELRKATQRAEALKDLHGRLQVLRGEVIRGMLEPVERTAREIMAQVDPTKEFRFQFSREGLEVLDFGFEQDGVFRSFAAASNGESALLVTVFLAALLDDLSPPWRVLVLDNAEAIDDDPRTENRKRFLEAIARMGDRFDNVIVAACGASALEPVEGWEVIDVAQLTGALQRRVVAA